jgi:hypothetical protein
MKIRLTTAAIALSHGNGLLYKRSRPGLCLQNLSDTFARLCDRHGFFREHRECIFLAEETISTELRNG